MVLKHQIVLSLNFRDKQNAEQTETRKKKAAEHIRKVRENETDSQYDRRLEGQRHNDAKDKKSTVRRLNRLSYFSQRRKSKEQKESRHQKIDRIQRVIENKNWKDQYTW